MKMLVLVLAARIRPYPRLIETIRTTWASSHVTDVETIFYFGGSALALSGDELILPVPDDASHIGHKTVACFDYLLTSREFDLIFRTNCSSYVDLPNLREFVLARNSDVRIYYGGFRGVVGGQPFASGSGYFLGRELMSTVVQRRARWRHKLPDDQAIAALLAEEGISPEETPRQDFDHVPRPEQVDLSQFHFRCRTDSYNRRRDRKIMRRIHGSFLDARRRVR
jgi:hypothetical protein